MSQFISNSLPNLFNEIPFYYTKLDLLTINAQPYENFSQIFARHASSVRLMEEFARLLEDFFSCVFLPKIVQQLFT